VNALVVAVVTEVVIVAIEVIVVTQRLHFFSAPFI
jgi:hypothetical protein